MFIKITKKIVAMIMCVSMAATLLNYTVYASYIDEDGKIYEPVDSTHHSITTVDDEGTSSTVNEECSFGDDGKCKCGNEKCKHMNTKMVSITDITHHNTLCLDCNKFIERDIECDFTNENKCICGNVKRFYSDSYAYTMNSDGKSVTISSYKGETNGEYVIYYFNSKENMI